MSSFLDAEKQDWTNLQYEQLRDLLVICAAQQGKVLLRQLAERAGISAGTFPEAYDNVRTTVEELIKVLGLQGKLRRLVEIGAAEELFSPRLRQQFAQMLDDGRPPSTAPYFAHPYPLQANFTGRIRERQMLTEWWRRGRRPVLVLGALGGMGKSALAWAWLQRDVLGRELPGHAREPADVEDRCRVADEERPEGVLWWSFYEEEANFAAFLPAALRYASGGEVDPLTLPSSYDKTRALVEALGRKRLLLVLDGFERELQAYAGPSAAYQGNEVDEDKEGQFRACTDPHTASFLRWIGGSALPSRVLITSRLYPKELDGLAACRREDLNPLDADDAVTFFRAQGIRGSGAEIEAACAEYGYHPLALRLLTGRIVRDPQRPRDVTVAAEYSVRDELVPREHHILALAYDALGPRTKDLLSRLAAFHGPVDYETAAGLSPFKGKPALGRALNELVERGLLFRAREAAETGRYDLHPVVRGHAYAKLVGANAVVER